ncbi:MAG: polyhydroxyalkanoate depolymerase [Casimicrobiaceae bacterium]|nr:polyhydroxyalkanoate depolymerase [Casimicrobiaceae bacterium]
MLYTFYEIQKSLGGPLRFAAEMSLNWAQSDGNPWKSTPPNDFLIAASEMTIRLTQEYPKRPFGIHAVSLEDRTVAVEESVIAEKPFCELRRFAKAGFTGEPRVLLVAPLSGHHATLLRDTVRSLVRDHEVFITDWRDARIVPVSQGLFHFDDYVAYVRDFLHLIGPGAVAMSVCQPTVPVLCAVSLMAEDNDPCRPLAMIMMGGPIDTRINPSKVNDYATRRSLEWFERHVITTVPAKYPGRGRRVYPGFLQYYGFVAMNPGHHAKSHWQFFLDLCRGDGASTEAHRQFYDEYNCVLDLDAAYYLETVDRVFQRHLLPRGRMEVAGRRIDPKAIRDVALFTIEGGADDISCPGQTRAAHELCVFVPQEARRHMLVPNCGHYGIFSGSKWRNIVYPAIRDFIAERIDSAQRVCVASGEPSRRARASRGSATPHDASQANGRSR